MGKFICRFPLSERKSLKIRLSREAPEIEGPRYRDYLSWNFVIQENTQIMSSHKRKKFSKNNFLTIKTETFKQLDNSWAITVRMIGHVTSQPAHNVHMRSTPTRSVTTQELSLLVVCRHFTKAYGVRRAPITLWRLPGYKSPRRAQYFHTYRALEPLWSRRQCSPGSASTALYGGWTLRVPQNLGARCAIFVSRADLRSRSLALQY